METVLSKCKTSPSGCLEYQGDHANKGYGRIQVRGVKVRTHRIVWAASHGDPGPMMVRHKCDNPPCCNIDHLEIGTALDNARDCISRNRKPLGEANSFAVLTPEKVREIRAEVAAGTTQTLMSLKLGVSLGTVNNVIRGKRWRHVT